MTSIDQLSSKDVKKYYHSLGSRIGYHLLLGGTKHFGYYKKGDRFWQFSKAMRQMEDYLGKNLDLPAASRVMDAGCGMGDVAIRLATKFGLQVDGFDLLDFNIAQANKKREALKLDKQLSFRVGDYTKVSLPDNYYDGIYTMETIMHVQDTPKTLKRFHRALKPGGKIILHEYSHAGQKAMPAKVFDRLTLLDELSAMPSMQKFEHGKLETMVRQTGFKKIVSKNIRPRVYPMVFGFYLLALVPYILAKPFGLDKHMTNASAAVFMKRHGKYLQYNVITALK